MDFSVWQIAIVLVIALLVFGPKRLPELGASLGRGMRDFKEAITSDKDDDDDDEKAKRAKLEAASAQPQPESGAEPVEGEVVTENRS